MKILITIPHYSTFIPSKFKEQFIIKDEEMNRHLDFGTEEIFDLSDFAVLKATASRFVVDLNRERNDLDEGQGVVITETWDGERVLKRQLTLYEIQERLREHYDPFYMKLDSFLKKSEKPLFVLDGHSMDSRGSLVSGDSGKIRPEICFATGKGTISNMLLDVFKKIFLDAGYHAEINNPYSGARAKIIHHVTEQPGVEALELEVNKSIYMDEKNFELKKDELKRLRATITKTLKEIEKL